MAFVQNNRYSILIKLASNCSKESKNVKKCFSSRAFSSCRKTFEMPMRKERSSIDILKALDNTVRQTNVLPHYRFHDDPYLIPYSPLEKRTYSLSKESGRKAARYILDSNPELFTSYQFDEPEVKAFLPKEVYSEDHEISAKILDDLISSGNVTAAVKVYRLSCSKAIEVSDASKQRLLELVSFYNETDVCSDEWYEEAFLGLAKYPGKQQINDWKSEQLADELFSSLEEPSTAAYSAYIKGLAKYHNYEEVWRVFDEASFKGIDIDVGAYNALISTISAKYSDVEKRWDATLDLLKSMAKKKLQPNLQTLNNCLLVLRLISLVSNKRELSLQLLEEFRLIGVSPSLASYYYVLVMHLLNPEVGSNMLKLILTELEKIEGEIPLRDPNDIYFFQTAMEMCFKRFKNFDLAKRIHALVSRQGNARFLALNMLHSDYYRSYLRAGMEGLPLSDFMTLYNEITPHIFSADVDTFTSLLNKIAIDKAFQFIPTVYIDIVATDQLVNKTFNVLFDVLIAYSRNMSDKSSGHFPLAANKPIARAALNNEFVNPNVPLNDQIIHILEEIADLMIVFANKETRNPKILYTAAHVGQLLDMFVGCGRPQAATKLLRAALLKPDRFIAQVPTVHLSSLCKAAINGNLPEIAVACSFLSKENNATEGFIMAEDIALSTLKLTPEQRAKLCIVYGNEIFKPGYTKKAQENLEERKTNEMEKE